MVHIQKTNKKNLKGKVAIFNFRWNHFLYSVVYLIYDCGREIPTRDCNALPLPTLDKKDSPWHKISSSDHPCTDLEISQLCIRWTFKNKMLLAVDILYFSWLSWVHETNTNW